MKILPIFIPHQGCPFDCIYCDQNKITQIQNIDLAQTRILIENFCKTNKDKNKEIAFFGGTFTNLPITKQNQLFTFVKPFLNEISGIRISTRPDAIDIEKLKLCQDNFVTVIELGIQSFSDKVLKEAKRGYTSKTAMQACKLVKDNGFKLGVQLMPGLPGYSETSLKETIKKTISLKPDFVRIYPTLVIQGTELEILYKRKKFTPLTLDAAVSITSEMITEFESKRIKVIKVGLHSDLRKEDIVAGPFHPAFGELVRAELLFNKIKNEYVPGSTLVISPKDISIFKGHNSKLIKRIKEYFQLKQLPMIIDSKLPKNKFSFKNIESNEYW